MIKEILVYSVSKISLCMNKIRNSFEMINKLKHPEHIEIMDQVLFRKYLTKIRVEGLNTKCVICNKKLFNKDISSISITDGNIFFICKDPDCINFHKENYNG